MWNDIFIKGKLKEEGFLDSEVQVEHVWTCLERGIPVQRGPSGTSLNVSGGAGAGGWGCRRPCTGVVSLYGEVQCIMGDDYMGPSPVDTMIDWWKVTTDSITFPQHRGRVVINKMSEQFKSNVSTVSLKGVCVIESCATFKIVNGSQHNVTTGR